MGTIAMMISSGALFNAGDDDGVTPALRDNVSCACKDRAGQPQVAFLLIAATPPASTSRRPQAS